MKTITVVEDMLEAKSFIRRLRGKSLSAEMVAEGGSRYVVKAPLCNDRLCVNEWLGARLFQSVGIMTAPVSPILIPVEVARRAWPEHYLPEPLIGAAVAFPVDPSARAIYDFLPPVIARQVANADHMIGTLLMDLFLMQTKPRQTVFYRDETNGGWWACMIDHAGLFGGPRWQEDSIADPKNPVQRHMYEEFSTREACDLWLDQIFSIPVDTIQRLTESVPDCWLDADVVCGLHRLPDRLIKRRARLPEMLRAVLFQRI